MVFCMQSPLQVRFCWYLCFWMGDEWLIDILLSSCLYDFSRPSVLAPCLKTFSLNLLLNRIKLFSYLWYYPSQFNIHWSDFWCFVLTNSRLKEESEYKIRGQGSLLTTGWHKNISALGKRQPLVRAAVSPWPKYVRHHYLYV